MSSTGTTLPANGEDLVTGFFELELNGNKTSKQIGFVSRDVAC